MPAEFTPFLAPGALSSGGFSMMDRASAMRQQQEMEDLQIQQLRAQLPAISAKARADAVSSESAIRAKTQMENLRRNAASVADKANEEYIGAIALPDWDQQAKALSALQAKYAWMGNVKDDGGNPLYKGFLDAVDNSTANAYVRGKVAQTITGQKEIQGGKTEAALEGVKLKAETQKQIADAKAETAKEIAELKAQNALSPSTKKFEETMGENAANYYNTVQSNVGSQRRTLDQIKESRRLLDEGAMQGAGAATAVSALKGLNTLGRALGFEKDLIDTSKEESLQRNYSDFALEAASRMQRQGQITEAERALLADTVAKYGNSPKAARYILDFMEAVANREIAKAQFLREQRGKGVMPGSDVGADFLEQNALDYFIPANGPPEKEGKANVDELLKKYRKK